MTSIVAKCTKNSDSGERVTSSPTAMPRIVALVWWTREVEVVATPLVYASWGRRMLSSVIDALVIGAIAAPITAEPLRRLADSYNSNTSLSGSDFRTLALTQLVVQVTYLTFFHGWRGATLGKMAARTVLVRDDGSKVTYAVAFARSVTLAAISFVSQFLIAPIIVNELRPLWSPRRQTWHDLAARTVVVRADSLPTLPEVET